jgi:hypothetical protein
VKPFIRAAGRMLRVGLAVAMLAVLGLMIRSVWQELEARRPQLEASATATVWFLSASAISTTQAIDRAQAQATAETAAAQATRAARYCTDPARAILRVNYHNRPNAYAKGLFDYAAQGSVENTCNYSVSIRLIFSSKYIAPGSEHSLFVFSNPLLPGEIREFNEVITWGPDPYAQLTAVMSIYD